MKNDCVHNLKKVREGKNGIVEYCHLCHERFVSHKGFGGKMNNREYLRLHRREFAQPTGRTSKLFRKLYGNTHKN